MKSMKVCEYSRSRSFHNDLILQDQASGECSQDQWSSGSVIEQTRNCMENNQREITPKICKQELWFLKPDVRN